MKNLKGLIVVSIVLLMLFASVAPTFACLPKLTFQNTNIGYDDPNHPGTRFTKDNIMHTRDAGEIQQVFGSPWGIITGKNIGNSELYLSTYTGSGVTHGTYTCAVGSYSGAGTWEFTGIAMYTYHGLSFTATTNTGGTFLVVDGTKFLGIGLTGQWCGHGIINGKHMEMRVTFSGVAIITNAMNHGLDGDSLFTGTTTYWFTG